MTEARALVVFCGAVPWASTRLTDQHVALQLAEYADVVYVDPPISALTRFRNPKAAAASGPAGLNQVAPGVWRISPRVLPLKERPVGKQIALALTRRAMRRAARQLRRPVRACVVTSLDPLFGAVREEHSVYYATDDYVAGADLMGIGAKSLRRLAEAQPRRADVVVAVSPVIADGLRTMGIEPLLIPNGVDPDHFAPTPLPPAEGDRLVGFVGHISERIDVRLLTAVADAGVKVRMIGPRPHTNSQTYFDALDRDNIEWAGPIPYDELPTALGPITTCLVPYGDTAFNRASLPLKTLEYLAAGRRVVSTGLPGVRWLDTDLVDLADTPEDFAAAVVSSLEEPIGEDEAAARRAIAAGHSWRQRISVLAAAIGLTAVPPPSDVS